MSHPLQEYFQKDVKQSLGVKISSPKTAIAFLKKSEQLMLERGEEYANKIEKQEERSFATLAAVFNLKTGKNITPAEVCLLLQDLKDIRQWSKNRYHQDSVEDCVSYAALKAEELYKQFNGEDNKRRV